MQRPTTTFISVHQERQDCAAASAVEKGPTLSGSRFLPEIVTETGHDLLMKTAAHPDQSMSQDLLESVGIGVTQAAKKLGSSHN